MDDVAARAAGDAQERAAAIVAASQRVLARVDLLRSDAVERRLRTDDAFHRLAERAGNGRLAPHPSHIRGAPGPPADARASGHSVWPDLPPF